MQGVTDRLNLAEVRPQRWYTVPVQRDRSRRRRAAGQRYRRDASQALEFQAHNRVVADRCAVIHSHQRNDLARVVQFEGLDFADLNATEIHAAARAQTARGAFEYNAKRALLAEAVDFLDREQADERRGDDHQRRRSDHEIARPYSHFNHPVARWKCGRDPAISLLWSGWVLVDAALHLALDGSADRANTMAAKS